MACYSDSNCLYHDLACKQDGQSIIRETEDAQSSLSLILFKIQSGSEYEKLSTAKFCKTACFSRGSESSTDMNSGSPEF